MPDLIWVRAASHRVPKGPGLTSYITEDPARVEATAYIRKRLSKGELARIDEAEVPTLLAEAAKARAKAQAEAAAVEAKAQAEAEAKAAETKPEPPAAKAKGRKE